VTITLDAHIPKGPIADKWTNHKFDLKLVNPSNRRKFDVIVVGSGLAGAAAAAILAFIDSRSVQTNPASVAATARRTAARKSSPLDCASLSTSMPGPSAAM